MSSTPENVQAQIDDHFKELYTQLNSFSKQARVIQESLRTLQKSCKTADRNIRARKKRPQEKLNITPELAKFLNVDSSVQLSKAEVMKQISAYIKDKQLQTAEDKRRFKPNKALSKIFGVSTPTPRTFVEINKLVSHHMTK